MNSTFRLLLRPLAVLAVLAGTIVAAPQAAARVSLPHASITIPRSGTFLYLNSEPGDYVGGGIEQLYTSGDSTFNHTSFPPGTDLIRVWLEQGGYAHWWVVDFAAPVGQALTVGSYTGAVWSSFRTETTPGLDVSGDGRACGPLTGQFDVDEISRYDTGDLRAFQATFEMRCEGATRALYGRLRIEDGPPLSESVAMSTRGTVDNKIGGAIVTGTVWCSGPESVDLSGGLFQAIANRETVVGTFSTHVECVAPYTVWSTEVISDNGRFQSGNLYASLVGYIDGVVFYVSPDPLVIHLDAGI